MGKIEKKVPAMYIKNMPSIMSKLQTSSFEICFTLTSSVQIGPETDAAGKPKLKFRKKGDTNWASSSLNLTNTQTNGKLAIITIEVEVQDIQIPNPSYIKPNPGNNIAGTPNLSPTISETRDHPTKIRIISLDTSVEKIEYQIPVTVKPPTYKVPMDGMLKSPPIAPILYQEEGLFTQKFKLNKRYSSIDLNQYYTEKLVPVAPTTGDDRIFHTLAFRDSNASDVLTIDSSKMTIDIKNSEGMQYLKLITKSNSNKVVKIPRPDNPQVTDNYTVPAADRTVTDYFLMEVTAWATPVLYLEPRVISGYKWDTVNYKHENVIDDYGRMEYGLYPKTLGTVNANTKQLRLVEPGHGKLEVRAYDKYDMLYDTAESLVFVEDAKNPNPVKIMLHNRKTNRLVTIKGNNKILQDIAYGTSLTSGVGVTRELFSSKSGFIATPTIIVPSHNTKNYEGKIISSPFKTSFENRRIHVGTIWEFSRNQGFTEIVDKRQKILGNMVKSMDLNEIVPPLVNCELWVRVRYIDSNGTYSEWSNPILFSAKDHNKKVGGDTIKEGDSWTGCYYGNIPKDELVVYNYRGEFQTLFNNNFKTFLDNMQVTHKGKKYNVKAPMNPTNVKVPGTETEYWELDERSNLPTPKNVVEMYGVAVGFTDRNVDGLSSGQPGIGIIKDTTAPNYNPDTDYKGWWHPDTDYTWMKFGHKGKILYVLNKPVCPYIAWNDIAKREAHDGSRTVRLGTDLYRLRLMSEEEYRDLFANLKSFTLTDICANDLETVRQEWILDNTLRPYKKQISITLKDDSAGEAGGRSTSMRDQDPWSRDGTWRPVLEWIRPGTEPYNFLPWTPMADKEDLIYDPLTDTGYFGTVNKDNFITFEKFCADVGFTEGALDVSKDESQWIKFYWHGKIVYIAYTSIRNTYNPDILQSKGLSYRTPDMQPYPSQSVKIGNLFYKVGQPTGCKWGCVPKAAPFAVADDIGQYSMWNELIYRVYGRWCTGVNNISGYNNTSGGHQIGENWVDLGMNRLVQGGGGFFINFAEPDGMTHKTERYYIQRGGSASNEPSLFHTWNLYSSSEGDDGYMPVLEAPQHFEIDESYFKMFQILLPSAYDSGME